MRVGCAAQQRQRYLDTALLKHIVDSNLMVCDCDHACTPAFYFCVLQHLQPAPSSPGSKRHVSGWSLYQPFADYMLVNVYFNEERCFLILDVHFPPLRNIVFSTLQFLPLLYLGYDCECLPQRLLKCKLSPLD